MRQIDYPETFADPVNFYGVEIKEGLEITYEDIFLDYSRFGHLVNFSRIDALLCRKILLYFKAQGIFYFMDAIFCGYVGYSIEECIPYPYPEDPALCNWLVDTIYPAAV